MSIPYLFIHRRQVDNNIINIKNTDDIRHLYGSLRTRPGDEVCLSDNDSFRYRTVLKEINKREAIFEITGKEPIKKNRLQISLFQCILKKNAMEFAIQKTTEIGVCRIIPVISSRTISDVSGNSGRTRRWQKISDEASKQSRRDFKCLIDQVINIEDIDTNLYEYFFLPYESASVSPAATIDRFKGLTKAKDIAYFIGPEGGLTPGEAELLVQRNALETSLGKNIFKAETAAVYFLSIMDFYIKSSKSD